MGPTLQEQIRIIQEQKGYTWTQIARDCSISSSALSSWLDGKYKGNNENIEKTVAAYLHRQAEKALLKTIDFKYVETFNAGMISSLCKTARIDHKLCVLTGNSGVGKTTALQHDARSNPGTVYVEIDPTVNAVKMVKLIRKRLGQPDNGQLEDQFEAIVNTLDGTERLIIIDQAELLSHKSLDILRCLHDKTRVGIILAGLPKLLEIIRGNRNQFEYLYTRIGSSMKLEHLRASDMDEIILSYVPEASPEAIEACREKCKKNARTLAMLLYNIVRSHHRSKKPIDKAMVEFCAQHMEV